jgi:hypothetical protein
MKKLLLFVLLFAGIGIKVELLSQSQPVLYFCERYDKNKGEIGVADRFTKGYLTVMVKCDHALGLEDVHVQFDKYNFRTGEFDYYKKFDYTIDKDMSYVFFAKNSDSDLKFEEAGFYRVFLLDEDDNTVASALIEIID